MSSVKRKRIMPIVSIALVSLAIGLASHWFWDLDARPTKDTPGATIDNSAKDIDRSKRKVSPNIYFIAVGDNGVSGDKIGCDDSVVAVTGLPVSSDNVIRRSIQQLISNRSQDYGQSGLYNALYQSNLAYVSSSVSDDTVTVSLTGDIKQSGVCDSPRIQAQLEQTAKHAAGASRAKIVLNGKPLSEVLSQK